MNPEITHLVPVLNSYWLMIHVAVITASYGFIGMSAFIGLLVLVLFSLSNPKNSKNVKNIILQLTTISEMSVTVGLYMLTIGTFLGGRLGQRELGTILGLGFEGNLGAGYGSRLFICRSHASYSITKRYLQLYRCHGVWFLFCADDLFWSELLPEWFAFVWSWFD